MESLHREVKALIKKRLGERRGHALLAEGKPKRKPTKKAAPKKKHTVVRHPLDALVGHFGINVGHALLAEGKPKRTRAAAMKKRGSPHALLEINKLAHALKRKHPHMEHKHAISEASALYRDKKAAGLHRSRRHSRR